MGTIARTVRLLENKPLCAIYDAFAVLSVCCISSVFWPANVLIWPVSRIVFGHPNRIVFGHLIKPILTANH